MPYFMSPRGDKMKTAHIQNFIQAHEKQEKYCSGMACAFEVLAGENKSRPSSMHKEYRK
jgi:hypothetical protein